MKQPESRVGGILCERRLEMFRDLPGRKEKRHLRQMESGELVAMGNGELQRVLTFLQPAFS